jgi:HPt (histidine-containing phosphotransfer) domain-containing protein
MAPDPMTARLATLRRIGGDRLIRDMIDLLFENAPRRLEAARAALAWGDTVGVGREAHALTSSAGNLGAVEMQQAALALERCAGGGPGDLAGLLAALEASWEQTRGRLADIQRGLNG